MAFWRSKELTFILTNSCNIDCVYCYPGNYKYGNLTLDLEFAKKGIEDFLVHDRLGNIDRIRFFGIGEPTTEFELMKSIHEYVTERVVKKAEKPITGEIQTNGVFAEEVAHWIGQNLDTICISCDGYPEVQDSQRPYPSGDPTSSVIARNVRILRDYSIDLGMRATVTQHTISAAEQKKIIDYAENTGFDYLYFHPLIPVQGSNKIRTNANPYIIDPLQFSKEYVRAWEYAQEKNIFVGNHFTINFDEETFIYCRSCLPCPQLTIDGYVSACDEALYGNPKYGGERFKDLIIGQFDRDRDEILLFQDKIKNIREKRHISNMDKCKDCPIATNCGGGCLGEALFSCGDPFAPLSDGFCQAMKYLAAHIPRNQGLFRYRHP
jgi:radical SAM protein with 4Fe4S-binding SPASM domain